MDPHMDAASISYGRTIKARGWAAGEPLIQAGERRFQNFRKWAYALGILLRAQEILGEAT